MSIEPNRDKATIVDVASHRISRTVLVGEEDRQQMNLKREFPGGLSLSLKEILITTVVEELQRDDLSEVAVDQAKLLTLRFELLPPHVHPRAATLRHKKTTSVHGMERDETAGIREHGHET